jgi:phosphoglycolate phosphatase-like HAD superfamily hydrolase
MSPRAILFDFDGTLIDSAASVLASLDHALKRSNVTPVVPLDRALIGPPLRQTLATLAGRDDPALLDLLAQAFRDDYDTRRLHAHGSLCRRAEMLQGLQAQRIALHVVTNKRIAATRRILSTTSAGAHRFAGVYALDALSPPRRTNRTWLPTCCAAKTCIQRAPGWSAIRPKTDARPRRTRYVSLPRRGVTAQRLATPTTPFAHHAARTFAGGAARAALDARAARLNAHAAVVDVDATCR